LVITKQITPYPAIKISYLLLPFEIFAKPDHSSKNCQNRVMPASFTGITTYTTVKLPNKVLSILFDV
jgi:hypothetical protein